MLFTVLGLVFVLISVISLALILIHAFSRSVGTGMMVLLIPPYALVYAFSQFEHRFKGLVVAGYLGCGMLGVVFRLLGWIEAARHTVA